MFYGLAVGASAEGVTYIYVHYFHLSNVYFVKQNKPQVQ